MNNNLKNTIIDIDLDINNYSLNDLYKLFHIQNQIDVEEMKNAKKIVLKMHPDKSKLDAKYFLFFSSAYKKLYSIYEFQNKNINKKVYTNEYGTNEYGTNEYGTNEYRTNEYGTNEYYKKEKIKTLDTFISSNKLKDTKNFNKWFNDQFEKHKIDNEDELNGYGDWLKSDEGIYNTESINMTTMHDEFEKQKKNIQAISIYNGIHDPFASSLGGTLLGQSNNNYSSGLFDNNLQFQDLRQAHIETIIPVSKEDYDNIPKFKSEQEYKYYRDNQDIKPIKEEEAIKKLRYNENKINEESANLAYYYAKQSEEASKKSNDFWSGIQLLK